jgi:hypothetical protein
MTENITPKGFFWRLKNSWYVLLVFLFPLSFFPFFYMGIKTSTLKWKIMGAAYMGLLLAPIPLLHNKMGVMITVFSYFAAIIQIFSYRQEYLTRLEIYQQAQIAEKEQLALRQSITEELHAKKKNNAAAKRKIPDPIFAQPSEKPAANNDFVQKIRNLNTTIPDKRVTGHLEEIEAVLKNIFSHLDKYPQKSEAVRT